MTAEIVANEIGWELVEKCAGGEFGAHLVRRGEEKAILKIAQSAESFASIRNGAELADRARSNGQLVPRFLAVSEWGDTGYTLQEWIEGDVPVRLTLPLAQRMIELLGTHEGVAADWPSDRVAGFGEWWAQGTTFDTAPSHIRLLAEEVIDARTRLKATPLRSVDVMHDDYHHKNLLVRDGEIVAIFDWDGAQPGDRWCDAFKLMWWSQAAANDFDDDVARWLRPHVEQRLSADELAWYAADIAIGQLEFFQRVYGGEPAQWIYESVQTFLAPYWR